MGSLGALTVTTHCLAPKGLGFVTIVLWSGTQSQPQVQRACQESRQFGLVSLRPCLLEAGLLHVII